MAIRLRVKEQTVRFRVSSDMFRLTATEGIPIYPETYTGEYEVIPTVEGQTLATRNLMMLNDVSVLAIPYYENPNQSGTTVYIANEV